MHGSCAGRHAELGSREVSSKTKLNLLEKTATLSWSFLSLQDIFLFQHLSTKQISDVVRVISREQVLKGDTVIKQGDKGEKFYIVDTGEFDVSRESPALPKAFDLMFSCRLYIFQSVTRFHSNTVHGLVLNRKL